MAGKAITAHNIKNELTGQVGKQYLLMVIFDLFVSTIEAKIGNDYSAGIVRNWKVTQGHLRKFL